MLRIVLIANLVVSAIARLRNNNPESVITSSCQNYGYKNLGPNCAAAGSDYARYAASSPQDCANYCVANNPYSGSNALFYYYPCSNGCCYMVDNQCQPYSCKCLSALGGCSPQTPMGNGFYEAFTWCQTPSPSASPTISARPSVPPSYRPTPNPTSKSPTLGPSPAPSISPTFPCITSYTYTPKNVCCDNSKSAFSTAQRPNIQTCANSCGSAYSGFAYNTSSSLCYCYSYCEPVSNGGPPLCLEYNDLHAATVVVCTAPPTASPTTPSPSVNPTPNPTTCGLLHKQLCYTGATCNSAAIGSTNAAGGADAGSCATWCMNHYSTAQFLTFETHRWSGYICSCYDSSCTQMVSGAGNAYSVLNEATCSYAPCPPSV